MFVVFDVLIFVFGCYWQINVYRDLPKHLKELRSTNPKTEKWPAILILGFSLALLLWMIRFILNVLF